MQGCENETQSLGADPLSFQVLSPWLFCCQYLVHSYRFRIVVHCPVVSTSRESLEKWLQILCGSCVYPTAPFSTQPQCCLCEAGKERSIGLSPMAVPGMQPPHLGLNEWGHCAGLMLPCQFNTDLATFSLIPVPLSSPPLFL